MHALVVGFELVLACEAVTFSTVLASDDRTLELDGVAAVFGGSVTLEVRPTLCIEAAILDETAKRLLFLRALALPVVGLFMFGTFFPRQMLPKDKV